MTARERRRLVVIAGHRGDVATITAHLADSEESVREAALSALQRAGAIDDDRIIAAFTDEAGVVRRRAAELAGQRPTIVLDPLLADDDPTVAEVAAWACGEQERVGDSTLDALIAGATGAPEPLVREACAAALGAIGDPRGLPAVIAACSDKPHVRRRAVLALAPFEGADVDAAIERALADRDWQVRQAAEDLRRAVDRGDGGESVDSGEA